ncbi:hypothetical protein ALC56_09643 [Trachymyrmex septentrionalis]|uniref:Uncharacterized protein n=1 Tax=Trachymyrmex septentrionalis TaxID=34720 RepID=A0A195F6N4_9HYME|nr:hypothetical protein ALC56_09643 [Trachymyrmex septentrionalis]
MCGCAGKVGAPIATGSKHRILGMETMQRPVFQAERDHTATFAVFHQQIEGEILDKIITIVAMASPISYATASMSLTTLAELKGLTTKSALIDLA